MLENVLFQIAAGQLASPGYGIYRQSDRTYLDFASVTSGTPVFSPTPTSNAAALAVQPFGGDVEEWAPAADLPDDFLAQIGTGGFIYKLFDMSTSPPTLSAASSPISVWIAGGVDQIPPGTATVTDDTVTAIAVGVLDGQSVGGGTVRKAIGVTAAAVAGRVVQSDDGTTTSISDWNAPDTVRITADNTDVGRTTSINP